MTEQHAMILKALFLVFLLSLMVVCTLMFLPALLTFIFKSIIVVLTGCVCLAALVIFGCIIYFTFKANKSTQEKE